MLACFARGSGLDGRGCKRQRMRIQHDGRKSYLAHPSAEEEEQVYAQLAVFKDKMSSRNRDDVEEIVLGGGANGITFVDGPRTSVELVGDVAVYFSGTLNEELSNDSESCAHEIWRRYNNRQQYPNGAIDLGPLSGEFSIIIFDKLAGCILAARDSSGAVPLYWGTSNFGECLLFSSDPRLLEESCADADAFPTGTLFVSKCGEISGDLNMLVSDEWAEGEEDLKEEEEEPDYLVKEDEARAAFHSPFGHGGFGSGSTELKRSWQNLVPSESPHGSELSLENLQQQPVA
mmetsp:Transcript_6584/g.27368  ORF Transcript_6584/g.27368 Transcript_6584/m.27368 type:complete len:289 (-) Transcript_6584:1639-2505(-)